MMKEWERCWQCECWCEQHWEKIVQPKNSVSILECRYFYLSTGIQTNTQINQHSKKNAMMLHQTAIKCNNTMNATASTLINDLFYVLVEPIRFDKESDNKLNHLFDLWRWIVDWNQYGCWFECCAMRQNYK